MRTRKNTLTTEEINMSEAVTTVTNTKQDTSTPRRRRSVFNGTQLKLTTQKSIPGYHLHVMTDSGNRIQEALDAGYEFVTQQEIGDVSTNVVSGNSDLGDRIRFLVNPRTGEGKDMYGYLMKQRLEWYEEDQRTLQAKNDQVDKAIKAKRPVNNDPSFYVPRSSSSIESELR